MRQSRTPARRQRGVAFVVVIWLMALLVILLGAFALIARTEGMQARHLYDATVARYAAEAGINQAAYFLSVADVEQRWIPDGRSYHLPSTRPRSNSRSPTNPV